MNMGWTSLIGLAAAGMLGCRDNRAAADRAAPAHREWEIRRPAPATVSVVERPLQVAVPATLVKEGVAPLVYLVESDGIVSVMDLTSNQRLARSPARARTIVRVDSRSGVFVGPDCLSAGPLEPDHRFGIFVEADQPSISRVESISPATGPAEGVRR
jgi:hypothetical protein